MPLKDRPSFGMNMNYYLVNWTGPVFEPFIRISGKTDGNAEGFFWSGKTDIRKSFNIGLRIIRRKLGKKKMVYLWFWFYLRLQIFAWRTFYNWTINRS